MKILYVTPAYKPAFRYGGPIVSVSAAAEMLVRKGHQVTVFTTNTNLDEDLDVPLEKPIDINGVQVWYFKHHDVVKKLLPFIPYLSASSGFLYSPCMKRHLRRMVPRVDVVHTQLPYVYPTLAGGRMAIRFKKPLFWNQRGDYNPKRLEYRGAKKQLYIKLFEMPLLRRSAALIALTQGEAESYRALGLKTPVRIIPNGIDVAAYKREFDPEIEKQWGIAPGATVVLFMGRLHPIKGADRLLQAFLQIHEQHPNAVLVMAGPDERGMRAEYDESVRRASLEKRIIFTGMAQGETKLNLLARADLFCLPSEGEGFSMAVLEALASATAVLLSPGCYFPEVETAGAGIVAEHDIDSLARALSGLLQAPEKLPAMGRAGLKLVSEKYTWDEITDALIDAYEKALPSRKKTRADNLPSTTRP